MRSPEDLVRLFRQRGYRVTPQRRAIFEALYRDVGHPTAEEIFQHVSANMPDISRTTVYNTIRELVALGELVEVEDLNVAGTRYDTNAGPHHHLFCMRCHRLVDVHRVFEGLDLPPEEAAGYQVMKRQVTFYGYCPDCQSKWKGRPGQGGTSEKNHADRQNE